MKWLSSSPAFALSATLIGVTMIPLATFWGFNLAIATAIISPVTAIVRLKDTDVRMVDLNWQAGWIGFWGWAVSSLLATAASVLASHAIYLAGLSVWYLVLAKQKWWKAVQLDTIIATVLLIVLDIAWFGKTIADAFDINADRIRLEWLLVVIDLTLCLVAALNVGIAIYCATKLKRRGDLVTGNLSGLFLAASLLWLLRCAFVLAVDLKTVIPDWTRDESDAQKIINPILDYWVSATVLGLVTFMVRNRVWSDPSVFADKGHWQQQQMYVQPVSQYPQPQYGQQQQPEVRRKAHQDYEQQ